jgi:hypothetical protein
MSDAITDKAGIGADLDRAHGRGVGAAIAGLQDPALGGSRITGHAVGKLAEAAVSSATPFLRAPLLPSVRQHPFCAPRCWPAFPQPSCCTRPEAMTKESARPAA